MGRSIAKGIDLSVLVPDEKKASNGGLPLFYQQIRLANQHRVANLLA